MSIGNIIVEHLTRFMKEGVLDTIETVIGKREPLILHIVIDTENLFTERSPVKHLAYSDRH